MYVLQKVNITEETEFWLMFYFLLCFIPECPSAFHFLMKGDHKSHGTQGQWVGNFQEQVILLLSVLAQRHQAWDCW